jgi:anti-sigma B factor antagonist
MRRVMEALTASVKTLNGKHAEIVAAGEIDASTQEQLRGLLLDVIDRGANDIVLDMAAVTFLDSSGLRGLIEAIQRGATVTLKNLQPAVQLVFDIVEIPGLAIKA